MGRAPLVGRRDVIGGSRMDAMNGRLLLLLLLFFFFTFFFLNTFFGPQAGIEPGSLRAVVDCYSRRLATAVDFHSAGASQQWVFAAADAVPAQRRCESPRLCQRQQPTDSSGPPGKVPNLPMANPSLLSHTHLKPK